MTYECRSPMCVGRPTQVAQVEIPYVSALAACCSVSALSFVYASLTSNTPPTLTLLAPPLSSLMLSLLLLLSFTGRQAALARAQLNVHPDSHLHKERQDTRVTINTLITFNLTIASNTVLNIFYTHSNGVVNASPYTCWSPLTSIPSPCSTHVLNKLILRSACSM
jgi:hypothetical protein